jgi:hypothetical protein
MSKIIMTFEAYQTYSDYSKVGKGVKTPSPEELLKDVTVSVKHILPTFEEKWIKSIEEQSDEKKGIKFEIKLSSGDVIHAFKISRWWGQWEWYLNKKKKSKEDIETELFNKLLTPFDRWKNNFNAFDRYYMYSDDRRSYNSGRDHEKQINSLYDALSNSDKKKAYKYYTESGKVDNPVNFPEFKGL